VKLVYCGNCDAVSALATMEREACRTCGKTAARIDVPRPWQYWVAIAVILTGAAILFLSYIPEIQFRFLVLLPFLGLGLFLSTWGMRVMKDRALETGRAHAKGRKA
jgi:hypothetical protein